MYIYVYIYIYAYICISMERVTTDIQQENVESIYNYVYLYVRLYEYILYLHLFRGLQVLIYISMIHIDFLVGFSYLFRPNMFMLSSVDMK
jgi:hypothetical protein